MSVKYAFVAGEEGNYSIRNMCAWAGVSRSGYYDWTSRAPSATAQRRQVLTELIAYLFHDSDGAYGYRRIHAALHRVGHACDPHTVRAIMRKLGLEACQSRRRGPRTTIPGAATETPDVLQRDFTATEPGLKGLIAVEGVVGV